MRSAMIIKKPVVAVDSHQPAAQSRAGQERLSTYRRSRVATDSRVIERSSRLGDDAMYLLRKLPQPG